MLFNESHHKSVERAIQLARRSERIVLAKGVEDKNTLEALAQLGCDLAQGYFIARPLGPDDFIAWLIRTPLAPLSAGGSQALGGRTEG
jgi:EAL domain-containing protein (putative c-di-GMP-specific phosphodiesterase class I)